MAFATILVVTFPEVVSPSQPHHYRRHQLRYYFLRAHSVRGGTTRGAGALGATDTAESMGGSVPLGSPVVVHGEEEGIPRRSRSSAPGRQPRRHPTGVGIRRCSTRDTSCTASAPSFGGRMASRVATRAPIVGEKATGKVCFGARC